MLAARKVPARAEVDRGPAREPDVGRARPATTTATSGWPSTPTAPSWPPTSTSSRTSAPTRRRGRCSPPRPSACSSPGRTACPRPASTTRRCSPTPPGLHAYRGPWQFETLAREMLLDIAARQMGIDPVELRRRNLLRGDELPYSNPNGMPYDHVSPLETFEQAVTILDYEGFRKEQADALAAGPLPRGRLLGLRRADRRGDRHLATEGATIRIEPTGKVNVYVTGGSSGQQHRDHRRAAHRRRARRRHRRRRHDPGRHRGDAVRRGHPGQPQRVDDRRRGRRDGHDPARADRRDRRPPSSASTSRHRARRLAGQRPRATRRRA